MQKNKGIASRVSSSWAHCRRHCCPFPVYKKLKKANVSSELLEALSLLWWELLPMLLGSSCFLPPVDTHENKSPGFLAALAHNILKLVGKLKAGLGIPVCYGGQRMEMEGVPTY